MPALVKYRATSAQYVSYQSIFSVFNLNRILFELAKARLSLNFGLKIT